MILTLYPPADYGHFPVAELAVCDDALCGREVLVRFTDGTQISACVGVEQVVEARYGKDDTPDNPIWTLRG
jgi:hypothetical protein